MRWEMQAYAIVRWADRLVTNGPLEGSNRNLFEELAVCSAENRRRVSTILTGQPLNAQSQQLLPAPPQSAACRFRERWGKGDYSYPKRRILRGSSFRQGAHISVHVLFPWKTTATQRCAGHERGQSESIGPECCSISSRS